MRCSLEEQEEEDKEEEEEESAEEGRELGQAAEKRGQDEVEAAVEADRWVPLRRSSGLDHTRLRWKEARWPRRRRDLELVWKDRGERDSARRYPR